MIITTAAIFTFIICSAAVVLPRQIDFALMAAASMVDVPVGSVGRPAECKRKCQASTISPEICQGDYG